MQNFGIRGYPVSPTGSRPYKATIPNRSNRAESVNAEPQAPLATRQEEQAKRKGLE